MSDASEKSVSAVTGLVRDIVTDVFGLLDGLRSAVEALIRSREQEGVALLRQDLAVLRPDIEAVIRYGGRMVAGAGFVPAPGTLTDERMWLEWWVRSEEPEAVRRLLINLDPTSDHYVDFTRLPWYDTPMRTGRPHITGPYVDYVCTDEYSLTFTMPVGPTAGAGQGPLGVVGADIYVSDLEPRLLPHLARMAAPALLVNAQGRVVVSTTARHTTGSLIHHADLKTPKTAGSSPAPNVSGTLHRCGDAPLSLVVLGS
ncbi:hypothetical protein AAW14_34595 [Streptomyces hygroscopicus]|nr:hypothetical protein [Streptomyces hygroscopicus]